MNRLSKVRMVGLGCSTWLIHIVRPSWQRSPPLVFAGGPNLWYNPWAIRRKVRISQTIRTASVHPRNGISTSLPAIGDLEKGAFHMVAVVEQERLCETCLAYCAY